MAENLFNVQVGLTLNDNNLESQIKQIQEKLIKNSDIKLKIDFGSSLNNSLKEIGNITTQIENLSKQVNNLNNSSRNIKLSNLGDDKYKIDGVLKSLSEVQKVVKDLGIKNVVNIDINGIDRNTQEVTKFIVKIKEMEGVIKNIQFDSTSKDNGKGIYNVTNYEGAVSKIVDTTDKVLDQVDKFKSEYQKKINSLKDIGLVKDDSISKFEEQLNNLNINNFKSSIDGIKNSFKGLQTESNDLIKSIEKDSNAMNKVIESQIKEVNKLEENFQSLKYIPNKKQSDINSLKESLSANSSKLNNGESVDSSEIESLVKKVTSLSNAWERANQKDEKELNTRKILYNDIFNLQDKIEKQSLKLESVKTGDSERKVIQENIDLLKKEYDEKKKLFNDNYYNKDVSQDLKTDKNEFNFKSLQQKAKEIDSMTSKFNSDIDNIKNKYSDTIDIDKINKIEDSIRKLSPTNKNLLEDINNITNKFKELELSSNKTKEIFNEQSKVIQYVYQQEERLKNLRSSYSNKIDTNSDGFKELESKYNSIIKDLNEYKNEGKSLSLEQSNEIRSRISDLNREKMAITDVYNYVKSQENTLDNMKSKFKDIINPEDIDKIKQQLKGLYTSSNLEGDKNGIDSQIKKLSEVSKESSDYYKKQQSDLQKVIKFVDEYNEKISNLYKNKNDGISDSQIIGLEKNVNNLSETNDISQFKNIENEYKNLINLQDDYAKQIQKTNQEIKEQESLYTYIENQRQRLENIKVSSDMKLDTNSNEYKKLGEVFDFLNKKLEQYKRNGEQLSVEEKANIRSDINAYNDKKNAIVEVTNYIKQQQSALENFNSKFQNVIGENETSEINKIKESMNGLYTSNNFKGDSSNIESQINQLKTLALEKQRIQGLGENLGGFSTTGLNMDSSTKELEKFIKSTQSYKAQVTSISESIDQLGNKVKQVNYTITNGNQVNKFRLNLDETSKSTRNLSLGMQDLTSKHATFAEQMKQSISGLIRFTIAGSALFGTINQLKQGMQEISEINKSNVNTAMITGDSISNVEKGNKKLLDLAENLKVVNSEVLAGQESWLRSGVTQEEANKNLETTTKLSKIAGVANKEMADSLIVIKNAYDLNSQSLEGYASKVSLLDNQSATSSEKINAAMQYSAQTFKAMGVDMDTALSWITNYSEKSAEAGQAIGNHFKSLLENFHKLKAGFKSQDEESVQSVNKIESLLSSKGISLRKNKDEWNDIGEVITKIQQNIGKFTEVQKSDLAFKIGGKENAEATLATLNNMKRINELKKDVQSDSGAKALNESYEKYKQGIEAQLANLKNSMTSLWMNVFDANKMASIIGGFTNFVNVLGMLTTTSKSSGIALAGLSTAIIVLSVSINKLGFSAVSEGLSKFLLTISSKASTLIAFFQLLPAAISETGGVAALLSTTFGGLATSIKAVTMALLTNPLTWVIAALGVATYAVIKHVKHQADLKQETQDLTKSYQDLTEAMAANNVEGIKSAEVDAKKQETNLMTLISNQKKSKDELDKAMKNLNSSPTNISYQMAAQTAQLAYDDSTKKVKEQEKAIKDSGYTIDETTGKIKELDKANIQLANNNKMDEAKSKIDFYNQALSELDNTGKLSAETTQLIATKHKELIPYLNNEAEMHKYLGESILQQQEIEQQVLLNELKDNSDFYSKMLTNNASYFTSIKNNYGINASSYKTYTELIEAINKTMLGGMLEDWDKYYGTIDEALQAQENNNENGEMSAGMHMNGDPVHDAKYKTEVSDIEKKSQKFQKGKELIKSLETEFSKGTGDFNKSINGTTDELNDGFIPANKDATTATKEQTAAIKEANNAMKDYENQLKSIDNLLKAQQDYTEGLYKGSQKYRDSLKDELSILKKKEDILKNSIGAASNQSNKLGGSGSSILGQQVVADAQKYLGTPYVWGGESTSGFDCSGLVQYVFKELNKEIGRSTYDQIKEGTSVNKDQLQPGDLVFFGTSDNPHHVGIYAGNGEMVEAPHTGANVRIASIDRSDYLTARRIVSGGSNDSNNSSNTSIPSGGFNSTSDFVSAMTPYAEAIKQKYGVPASLLMAQAIVESGGTSNLAKTDSNYFGMTWTGNNGQKGTARPEGGNYVHYDNLAQSVEAYGKLLSNYGVNGQSFDSALDVVANHGYAADPNYKSSVKSVYDSYGLEKYDSGNYPVANMENITSELESLQSKALDDVSKLSDVQKREKEIPKLMYESNITEIEDITKAIDTRIQQLQTQNNIEEANNAKSISNLKIIRDLGYDKVNNLKKEKEYLDEQFKNPNNIYNDATVEEIKEKISDITTSILEANKTIKEQINNWIQGIIDNIENKFKDSFDMISNELSRLENQSTIDLGSKLLLESQKVELTKQKIEEVTNAIKELSEYQKETNDTSSTEKLKELTNNLDALKTTLSEVTKNALDTKNSISDLATTVTDKIKQVIQKNAEIYKNELESNKKIFEDAIDKEVEKLDEAQKKMQNNSTNYDNIQNVVKLQQQLNALDLRNDEESKSRKADIQKELDEANRKLREDNQNQDIEARKDSLSKAKSDYDKAVQEYNDNIEKSNTDENLNKQSSDALINGFIVDEYGNKIDLESALKNYEDRFGQGLTVIGNKIKTELIDKLKEVQNLMNQFKTLDSTKIDASQAIKTVYGTGIDLENAKSILGANGYNYIDTNMVSPDKLQPKEGDIVLGNAIDSKLTNGATNIAGEDRYKTEQKIQMYSDSVNGKISPVSNYDDDTLSKYVQQNSTKKGTIYASGNDLLNAEKYLSNFGYNFVDTNNISQTTLSKNDVVVGGAGVMKGISNALNVGSSWLWGMDSKATEDEIKKFAEKLTNYPIDTKGFSDGGDNFQTGLSMLHGTSSKPETVLNYDQGQGLHKFLTDIPSLTKNIMSQVYNSLPSINTSSLQKLQTSVGDVSNKYEINFNVDKMNGNEEDVKSFGSKIMNYVRKRG